MTPDIKSKYPLINGINGIANHPADPTISLEITLPESKFPVKRSVSDSGSANSLIILIGINKNANHHTGPTKLLR